MQYPDCENPSIQVTSGSNQSLNSGRCALYHWRIARTAANVRNGGRTPIAGIVHCITLTIILLVLMPLAALIPMTTLAAVLLVVAANMADWTSFFRLCKTAPKSDIIVLVATFFLTVFFDLVVAIEIGVVLAALLFMKRMAETAEKS